MSSRSHLQAKQFLALHTELLRAVGGAMGEKGGQTGVWDLNLEAGGFALLWYLMYGVSLDLCCFVGGV